MRDSSDYHYYPSLVLVQPRKTRPFLTEGLLMGRKESNQTKKEMVIKSVVTKLKTRSVLIINNAPITIIYNKISVRNQHAEKPSYKPLRRHDIPFEAYMLKEEFLRYVKVSLNC